MAAGRWLPRDTLQTLLTIKHTSILDSLTAACTRGGWDAALERYRWFTDNNFHNKCRYGVGALNQVGYQLMGDGHVADALRAFRLNVEEYPADWNVFDSYGEACMKAGMKELAIESYERAPALDPSQENPRKMLQQLRQQ
jgi:tetratricopeptide (TPR) repeat protein